MAGVSAPTIAEYYGGYDTASGQVVLPAQMTGETNSKVTVKYPKTTTSGSTTTRAQSSEDLYLVCESDFAYILDKSTTTGAKVYAKIANPGGGGEITAITHVDTWEETGNRYKVVATASGDGLEDYSDTFYVDASDAINSVGLIADDTGITSVGSNDIRINKGSTSYKVGTGGSIEVIVYVTLSNGKRFKRSMGVNVGATSYAQRTYTLRVMNNNTGAYTTLNTSKFYFYG